MASKNGGNFPNLNSTALVQANWTECRHGRIHHDGIVESNTQFLCNLFSHMMRAYNTLPCAVSMSAADNYNAINLRHFKTQNSYSTKVHQILRRENNFLYNLHYIRISSSIPIPIRTPIPHLIPISYLCLCLYLYLYLYLYRYPYNYAYAYAST
jgi:hypothetical protein